MQSLALEHSVVDQNSAVVWTSHMSRMAALTQLCFTARGLRAQEPTECSSGIGLKAAKALACSVKHMPQLKELSVRAGGFSIAASEQQQAVKAIRGSLHER